MERTIPAAVVADALAPGREKGKWWLDLIHLIRWQLDLAGVPPELVTDSGCCTWSQPERFFSFRRDGQTGRLASFILRRPVAPVARRSV
jgi:copper oxidase (laccase) domain-containing protein